MRNHAQEIRNHSRRTSGGRKEVFLTAENEKIESDDIHRRYMTKIIRFMLRALSSAMAMMLKLKNTHMMRFVFWKHTCTIF